MNFTYPDDILPLIRKAWRGKRVSGQKIPPLPQTDLLKQFLEIAFHTSLLTEEQRRIGFRLALISRRSARKESESSGVHQKYDLVEFAVPRDFSVTEVLRLAPATDMTRTLICVQPSQGKGRAKREHLHIWGLIHTGSSWWEFTHGECLIGVPPPNCFTVASTEPGNLAISREGDLLLSLRRGEIVAPAGQVLTRGPISKFLASAGDAIYRDACNLLGEDAFDPGGQDDSFPKRLYTSYLERLLFEIREKRHGGTLIVVPNDTAVDDWRLTGLLQLKYPSSYDRTWSLLTSSLALRRKYFDLYFRLWNRRTSIPVERYQELNVVQIEREEIERRISDSIALQASTSGVDGAVVMTDRLRLLGFGAEVVAPSPELSEVHLAEDPMAQSTSRAPIDSFGTRHRSAFRFCSQFQDSVAFVISQDSGVKGVKWVGDRLILWPDISLGPLGI